MNVSKRIIACLCTVLLMLAAVGCIAGERAPSEGIRPAESAGLQMPEGQKQVSDMGGQTAQTDGLQVPAPAATADSPADGAGTLSSRALVKPAEKSGAKAQKHAKPAAPPETGSSAPDGNSAAGESVDKPAAAPPDEGKSVCTIAIYDGGNTILEPVSAEFREGDHVLDILKKVTRSSKIQMEYRGGENGGAYVEGIDNLYEFDRGAESGWMYNVNGKYPNYGCGAYKVKKGDVIEWRYTEDLGKDLGAYMGGE